MASKFKPNPNSFKNTFCVFKEVDHSCIEGLQPDFFSESGSKYFYTQKGMYRLSNHWGRLANSKWRLVSDIESGVRVKLGFALWDDFYPDNNFEELYYLEVNWDCLTILYQHKNNKSYDGKAVLRTAQNTMKRVKLARNIMNLTNWAKHFESHDIDSLRKNIVNELIYTNKSIETIKRDML